MCLCVFVWAYHEGNFSLGITTISKLQHVRDKRRPALWELTSCQSTHKLRHFVANEARLIKDRREAASSHLSADPSTRVVLLQVVTLLRVYATTRPTYLHNLGLEGTLVAVSKVVPHLLQHVLIH